MATHDPFRDARAQVIDMRERFRSNRGLVIGGLTALILFIGVLSSYYQVEPDELGVVLRFGKHVGNTEPGPHLKLPFGIDEVVKVPVQRQLKMEFGFRTVNAVVQSEFAHGSNARAEAEMLTGDLNVGMVEWIVQYKITNPEKYLFRFRDMSATLRLMTEATMRQVVGDHSIDELITGGREGIEIAAKEQLADLAKRYDAGVTIQQLKLQDANAPDPVKPALREVEEAKQERERAINDAWADYNKVVPRARGSAEQSIQAAEGYAIERENRAQGDAQRFKAMYAEFRKAPDVTRTRLYLEAMAEILPKAKKKIIVDKGASNVLPLLNLNAGGK